MVVDGGTIKELPDGDVVKSAISDTNDNFDASTVDEVIDEIGGKLLSLVATDPTSPATGSSWVNTTDNQLKVKTASGTLIFDAFQYEAD